MKSTATYIPPTADPYDAEVRQAIADIIRDWYPTEVRNFTVDEYDDVTRITAELPAEGGHKVIREVYRQ